MPLLPALAWVVLSVVRVGDVALVLVVVAIVGMLELVWLLRSADGPRVRQPAIAAGACLGLMLGVELGFAFGGGPGLVLVSATAYLGARATLLAAVIAASASARARGPLFAWRRTQVANLVVSLVLWLVLLGGQEASAAATGAVRLHGIRFDLPGGTALLLVLLAVSIGGEGVLQYRAYRTTEAWIGGRDRRAATAPRAPTRGFLDDIDADDFELPVGPGLLRDLEPLGDSAVHGPSRVPTEPT